MKRITGRFSIFAGILLAAFGVGTAFAVPGLSLNYVVNGDFETKSGDTSPWFGVNGSFKLATEGSNHYCRTSPGTVVVQAIDVKGLRGGSTVRLSGTARIGSGKACIDIAWTLASGAIKTDTLVWKVKEWGAVSGVFKAPLGFQSVNVRLRYPLSPAAGVPQFADFDDISLTSI